MRRVFRFLTWAPLWLVSGCFSDAVTIGSICAVDGDCGQAQVCQNQVCGRCENGRRQSGEICVGEARTLDGPDVDLLVVADLEGDGLEDLVVRDVTDASLWIIRNGPDTFLATRAGPDAVVAMGVGNLDGETGDEVIVTREGGEVVGLVGDPIATLGGFLDSVAIGDLNGDARGDLVIGDSDQQLVHVMLGAGNGSFQTDTPVAGCAAVLVGGVADLTQDGRADVVVACRDESRVLVLEGNGRGGVNVGPELRLSRPVTAVGLVDLDGDLDPDLVVLTGIGQVELFYSRDGGLDGPQTLETEGVPIAVTALDLTADGRPELVVADRDGLSIFPSRFGVFPDLVRRDLEGPVTALAPLDRTGLGSRDLAIGAGPAILLEDAP